MEVAQGTRITGELQNSIDVRKVQVGDQVVLKTSQAIKSGGQTVVNKGARLFGHVTEATQKTKDNNESRLGLLFDRIENGPLEVPITASITSIGNAHTNGRDNSDLADSDVGSSSSRTTSSQGGGGIIGGVTRSVTSTTASVVDTTTSAVGTAVRGTTNAVGGLTGATTQSLGKIQITESTDASVATGSILTLRGENLRLVKGTTLNLVVSQSASLK
jgi:hypothetical protein